MPTPGGLLKAGDRLRYVPQPGDHYGEPVEAKVVERHGNDRGYSIVLERVDGKDWLPGPSRRGDPKQMLLLEAHYWVFMHQGGWGLVRKP